MSHLIRWMSQEKPGLDALIEARQPIHAAWKELEALDLPRAEHNLGWVLYQLALAFCNFLHGWSDKEARAFSLSGLSDLLSKRAPALSREIRSHLS